MVTDNEFIVITNPIMYWLYIHLACLCIDNNVLTIYTPRLPLYR